MVPDNQTEVQASKPALSPIPVSDTASVRNFAFSSILRRETTVSSVLSNFKYCFIFAKTADSRTETLETSTTLLPFVI